MAHNFVSDKPTLTRETFSLAVPLWWPVSGYLAQF